MALFDLDNGVGRINPSTLKVIYLTLDTGAMQNHKNILENNPM
jgi:hypothetical protein